jgi:hypothetical protein
MMATKLSHWEIAALIFNLYDTRQGAVRADDDTTAIVVDHLLSDGSEQRRAARERLRCARLKTSRLSFRIPRRNGT